METCPSIGTVPNLVEGPLLKRSICSIKGNVSLQRSRQMGITPGDCYLPAFFGGSDCVSKFAALAVRRSQRSEKNCIFPAGNLYCLCGQTDCRRSIPAF